MDYKELNLKKGDLLTAAHMAHIEEGIDAVTAEVANMKIAKIVLRNDSTENWAAVAETTILLKGEPAIEFTAEGIVKLKIGDGVTPWKTLPYFAAGSGDVVIPENIQEQMEALTALVETFDTRISNTETDVETAILTAESTVKMIEELQKEFAAFLENQEAASAEIKVLVENNAAIVEEMSSTVEEIKNTQDEQEAKIDTANNRVDILVSNFTDNAEFDNAELVDIRAGYDGKTYESAGAAVRQIGYDLNELSDNLVGALGKDIVDGLSYESNQLYLTANGEKIGDPVTITGGGGSGSGNQTYTMTLLNLLDSRAITITGDDECVLDFSYHSIDDDGFDDGAGIGYIYVNNSLVSTLSIPQGDNSYNITSYLNKGENSVKIQVENSEGSRKTLTYTVNVLVLSVTTTAPKMSLYSGQVSLPYTVTGAGSKTVHFVMDGREIATDTVATSGNSRVVVIPPQADGAHILQIYAEVSNGLLDVIKSNVLEIGMLYHSSTTTTQAILLMHYEGPEKVEEGATLVFPYMVYDPFLQTTDIKLNIYTEENELYSSFSLQVDQQPKEWVTQDYPAGKSRFEIVCKDTSISQEVEVIPTTFDKEIITDGCVLDFNARGRSNNESNPASWEYKGITAEFNGFGWANVDGWMDIKDKETGVIKDQALRFLPGDTMNIKYKPFEQDFRVNGYTIEAEFGTHNVRDYDSIIIDALDNGKGLSIKSQQAQLTSQQSSLDIQFKEDSRVRITFIVEPTTLNNFVYIYVNGIMSRVIKYPDNDNFEQVNPVEIFIGSESCGLDLYSLRMYSRGLTRHEQLDNFICDRPTLAERIEADNNNDVLDENDQISIAHLPMHIPYIILECEKLPATKGDKQENKTVTYVEPLNPNRNFTAAGVTLDVQGTSSAGYPVKNYKVSLKKGLTYSNTGETAAGFPITIGGLEGKNICLKADFASSEQANNVCLVDYYEELCPYKNPAQMENELVRTAVRGFPCVVFWKNTTTNEIKFLGKYNFNDDKSNENLFGFDREKFPKCECVEFLTNGSDLTKFQSNDYNQLVDDGTGTGTMIPAWQQAFEFRFPDTKPAYSDFTQFKRMTDWVYSTWDEHATGELLENEQQLPLWNTGVLTRFTNDTPDYRLSKFKAEFDQYFIKDAMNFYYLFTEVFLLVDNRAKNMFLTTFDGEHWFPIPYDMDTAIGINNEGLLAFEYDLEDYDKENSTSIFNCGSSVLWTNYSKVFKEDLSNMYKELRSGTKFNYEYINNKMKVHQEVWPEAIWNEDEYTKYIGSYIDLGSDHLSKLQGDKKSQRDWWLFNGFKYRDSKYFTGDAKTNFIYMRMYQADAGFTITPYQHLHPRVEYDRSTLVGYDKDQGRVKRNQTITMPNPKEGVEIGDLNVYIYSADRLASVGDLSPLKIGDCDFSSAVKLQEIILGSEEEDYTNPNMESLTVGDNELLTLVNVSNCNNAKFTGLDLSGCHGLETLLAEGTKLTGVMLPNGGHLKTLKLPSTIANLTIQNQKNIEVLSLQSQESLEVLRIENTPGLPIENLINNSPILNRVRLTNIEWNATSEATLRITMDKLIAAKGLNANGLNTDKAVVTGRVHIDEISDAFLEEINDNFPELVVVVNGVAKYFVRYADWDNTLLYRYIATEGTKAIDPIEMGYIEVPTRESTETAHYTYNKWSETPETINRPYSIIAQYIGEYLVRFYDLAGNILNGGEQWVLEGESATDPVVNGLAAAPKKESTQEYDYYFSGWDLDFTNIDGSNLVFYPVFREELRSYWVRFYNDEEKIQESRVFYGDIPIFTGDMETIYKYIGGEASPYYEFIGWDPDPTQPILGDTNFYAQFSFDGYIEDSWEEIIANCKVGNIDKYGLGGRKQITYTLAGVESTVEMEIVGKNHDRLVAASDDYNNGASTASLSFMGIILGRESWYMNATATNEWNANEEVFPFPDKTSTWPAGFNWGGWEFTKMRKNLQGELFATLPAELQNSIKPVVKLCDFGRYYPDEMNSTHDTLWIPSARELNGETYGTVATHGQGEPYPIFNLASSRIKWSSRDNSRVAYWTRSSDRNSSHNYRYVDMRGNVAGNSGANSMAVAFGFCL